jgi:hypothetical protein
VARGTEREAPVEHRRRLTKGCSRQGPRCSVAASVERSPAILLATDEAGLADLSHYKLALGCLVLCTSCTPEHDASESSADAAATPASSADMANASVSHDHQVLGPAHDPPRAAWCSPARSARPSSFGGGQSGGGNPTAQHVFDLDDDGDADIVWAEFGPSDPLQALTSGFGSSVYAFLRE